ncbi:uncharacterized protein B0T15DRAFT_508071 [Chaetomium strumarium]|uniref:Response regulatory domain-containing protein n=1 Tax=Chaetomium strumarium TaxID=1170767 RepID=A0AAJ0H4N8_9PEZI|nr:hypothetical protein B0T15DRAFT_508071 [Chaetomium strumarium]
MGDLRSMLRAKITRRQSGNTLPTAKPSSDSNNPNTSSSRPGTAVDSSTGVKDAATATATDSPPHADGSHTRQGRRLSGAQWAEKLRQGAKHFSAGMVADSSDANSGNNGPVDQSQSAATDQNKSGGRNATNVDVLSSFPPPPSPGPGHSDGQGPASPGNDRPHHNTKTCPDDSSQQQPAPPPTAPSTDEVVAKQGVSTDTDRRVRLSDPPVPSSRPSTRQGDTVDPTSNPHLRPSNPPSRPSAPPRRQSLLPSRQTTLIRTLLSAEQADDPDRSGSEQLLPISANMVTRKLWVKRPGASATLVTISEEDLVDDVREVILRKYANSLGRQYDAPDLTLRIVPREGQRQERVLGPEEPMTRTLDAYFPGGQTVDEALLIDVPHRRTPRASPRNGPPHAQHLTSVNYDDIRPLEVSTDYFGPGAIAHIPVTIAGSNGTTHAISVLNTGQVPQIPSPGGASRARQYRERSDRPRLGRQHTSSPTILNVVGAGGHPATIAVAASHGTHHAPSNRSRTHSNASSEQTNAGQPVPPAPPLPTPPTQESAPVPIPRAATPPPRAASPRPPPTTRPKKKKTVDPPALPAGMLNGGVPPINVLIVEDNIINLRLLEAFVKRLKVRWQTAMNGREAVNTWRKGGFHLVLMDIQLPVMSGLEATREIRRLERLNSIGAFSTTVTNAAESEESKVDIPEEDKLQNREMFKSPVIIVALTASSLQSDRHEALTAGCNDFLTKPVTYVWLERKVMEWGCMQALIDFDGWRKWKAYTSQKPEGEDNAPKKSKAKKHRGIITTAPNSSSSDGQ